MLTKRALALTLLVASSAALAAKDYDNFNLPNNPKTRPILPVSKLSYTTNKVRIRGKNLRLAEPSVDRKEYLFVKEAFLAERRDQALKLLRQELDSGVKTNRDNMLT